MRYIGIDVSKATLMVAYPQDSKKYKNREFQNATTGIHSLIATLQPDAHCVMEATGNYSYLLLYLLDKAGICTSMENPLKVKNFARTMLTVTKTDKADAQLLSLYGERMKPEPYKIPSEALLLLKQKRAVLRQFKKQLLANNNLRKALEAMPKQDHKAIKAIKAINKVTMTLEKQMAQLYVASWSMIKYNTACKELYTRLKERGKSGKLALVAVINKSIRQCFAVVKHDTDYQDGFVSEKPQTLPAGSACRQGSVGTLPTRQ